MYFDELFWFLVGLIRNLLFFIEFVIMKICLIKYKVSFFMFRIGRKFVKYFLRVYIRIF